MDGIGLIDPDLARDLAAAAARNPRSTWCVTVTDKDGHAVGHGCARPARRQKPDGHDPPGSPGFTFTPTCHPGPPGGYGTWRFTTGQQDLLIKIGPLPAGECDHRWEAKGHDPGVMLRHLTEVRHATCTVPAAGGPPGGATSSTTCRTKRAGGRACATGTRSAATTTGSSNTPGGTPNNFPAGTCGGPRRRDGSTSPNRPGTRYPV